MLKRMHAGCHRKKKARLMRAMRFPAGAGEGEGIACVGNHTRRYLSVIGSECDEPAQFTSPATINGLTS